MTHPFGHGFITDITPITHHFRMKPEQYDSGPGTP